MNPQTSPLFHADRLPLAVAVAEAPSPASLQRWSRDNVELIHALIAFDDSPREIRDDHAPYALELARLDAKLRLVLRLLARQVAAAAALPDPVELRLSAERLEWQGPQIGPLDADVVAELYLSTLVPEPLRLHGVLERATTTGESWQALRFEGHSGLFTDVLTRWVFQQHRRSVAHSRQSPG